MNEAIGGILPLALGVAISPVPVIAAILMLLSPAAGRTGTAFLLGWLVGIACAVMLFTALGGLVPDDGSDSSRPVVAAIQGLLGLALVALAVRQWRGRPTGDDEPELPAWMNGIASFTAAKAFGLGAVLAAANPKNLFLAIAAGVAVSQAELETGATALVLVIWVAIAACSVAVPVLIALAAPGRVAARLDRLRAWLAVNNATVMCVLMLVIGVNLIGKAISAL